MTSAHFNAMQKSWLDHVRMQDPGETTPALRVHEFLKNLVNYTATGMNRKEWGVVLQVAGSTGKGDRYPLDDTPYVQAIDQVTQNMHMTSYQAAQLVRALLHGPLKRHESIGPILERAAEIILASDSVAGRKAAFTITNYVQHERCPIGHIGRYRKMQGRLWSYACGVS